MKNNGILYALVLLAFIPALIQCNLLKSVNRGPYLQLATHSSIVVRWRTTQVTDTVVQYGVDINQLDQQVTLGEATREHIVAINNLIPDTRYYYAIGNTSKRLLGPDTNLFFNTAPTPGTKKPTRVWVLGDSGSPLITIKATYNAYRRFTGNRGTDLWIMLGDNAYPDGTDAQYQLAVFNIFPGLLRNTVLWPTLGNHDGHSADSATQSGPYYDIFSLPTGAEAGGVASGTEAYYSFDYANIHFICLESYETDRSSSGAMMTWLRNDLATTQQTWIIAYWHHPPYSKGSHDSDTEKNLIEMREQAVPILESYGADLILSGHSHVYERSYLINGHYGISDTLDSTMIINRGDGRLLGHGAYIKSPTDNLGTVYTVAGSSSIISSGTFDHPAMYIARRLIGSFVIDVHDNTLIGTFLDNAGYVRDQFIMDKNTDMTPPSLLSAIPQDVHQINLEFNERLDITSAQTITHFGITPTIELTAAVLSPDERTIVLTTSAPLSLGSTYQLVVQEVKDKTGNVLAQTQYEIVAN